MQSPSGSPLIVVDPHMHLWDTRRVRYPWLESRQPAFSGDNRLLPDPYGVPQLLQDATEVDLRMSVHVEANPENPVLEAGWLQSLADDPVNRGHPHGIVAYADLSRSDVAATLDALAALRCMRGIRQILNMHADARYRYVTHDYLADPLWRSNLARLIAHGWSFDL